MDSVGFLRASSLPLGPDLAAAPKDSRQGNGENIAAAAMNFESMFMGLVLKEMRQTLEPDGLFGEDRADIRGGLFDLYLGQHLTQAGGFGLAEQLQRQLKTVAPHENSTSHRKYAP